MIPEYREKDREGKKLRWRGRKKRRKRSNGRTGGRGLGYTGEGGAWYSYISKTQTQPH